MVAMAAEINRQPEFMDVDELAELLRLKPSAIYQLRWRGGGPPAIKVHGVRKLLFPRSEVDRWLRDNLETRGEPAPESGEAVGA